MARRNVWTPEETRELLAIIKELDLMKLFGEERNTKLYQITENEMKQRGYFDKDAFQIEHKWKNLKRSYYKTKRENYLAESCEYFEELDELMAMKPPAPSSSKGKESASQPKRPRAVLENFDVLLTKLAKVDRENNEEFFKKQKDLVDYEFDLFTHDERQYTTKVSQMLNRNMNDFCVKAQQILLQEGVVIRIIDETPTMEDSTEELELQSSEQLAHPVVKKEIVKEFYQTWREEEPF
ncbi:zinc finger protein with KRAB and SCAN domains 2-like [Anopheles merus]|uniref:Myb/SANT-like DNA-binding domain-containing protein n=1 Tax=Anopheles merus TaxID=30066 RepID=A0A182UXA1_ANOME|nr:zinc finger protein with KRAB and SCAN domains 2-like [Anopheles merus]XP_041786123.1 zinc finger protein with KRAB and SCAN domains 2-like [Anopheles merus]